MHFISALTSSVSSTVSQAAESTSSKEDMGFWEDICDRFNRTFIVENRWRDFLDGLSITVQITILSALLGVALGFLVAMIRSTHDLNLQKRKSKSFGDVVMRILMTVLNALCNVYITVIRGTPVVIQLLIMYNIIFASSRNAVMIAVISFGINSGAYVAEIVRSGIMSIDKGQFEASRSIGFDYKSTMLHVIMPQALKNILPALGNEFIVLVKETSVAGYVAIMDLTMVGNTVVSRTYDAFFPLISVAVFYLVLVMILSFFLKKLERRLRNSDH